ncbi:MAG: proteasome assembly chaperone family protein [Candidatus Hadarchaeales archaeon]
MNESIIKFLSKPKLKEPVLIEGLPGMGYVGKLAAEHLVVELEAEKFAELYSPYFPHHVYVEKGGVVRLVRNEFYWASPSGKDIIILIGDVQAISPEGHYEVTKKILDLAKQLGVKQLFTIGGYATGRYPRGRPKVIGVASDPELMEICKKHGAVIEEGDGPIVGASGLLLALGKLWGMRGICLLCETHGMVVDHRAAQSVLEVLTKILGIEVDMSELELRARETERLISRMRKDMELKARKEKRRMEEEAWYIG